jgi:hypothetical protein
MQLSLLVISLADAEDFSQTWKQSTTIETVKQRPPPYIVDVTYIKLTCN